MSEDNLAQFEEAVAILTKSGGVRVSARQHPCMHSCTWQPFLSYLLVLAVLISHHALDKCALMVKIMYVQVRVVCTWM